MDLSLWYMRLLHVSIIFKSLGPKLVMIQKMVCSDISVFFYFILENNFKVSKCWLVVTKVFDLMFFLLIIAVFVCSFGVTTQVTLGKLR